VVAGLAMKFTKKKEKKLPVQKAKRDQKKNISNGRIILLRVEPIIYYFKA
jgi:hypothetical protein